MERKVDVVGVSGVPISKHNNYKTASWAGVVVVVGVILLLAASQTWFDDQLAVKATVGQLGGLLVTTGVLAVLWELRGKRDIMDEMLEKANISSDVSKAGIQQASMDWSAVPWDDLFKNATHISVLISYGGTWRRSNWTKLQEFAKGEKNSLKIFLPDPEDEGTMRILAERYAYAPDKVIRYVKEAASEFLELGGSSPAEIKVHYRTGDLTYTCYRFDEKVVATLYSHKRQRGDVPAIVVGHGTFKNFFVSDLDAIEKQSRLVSIGDIMKEGE